jgi:hypothetical protein
MRRVLACLFAAGFFALGEPAAAQNSPGIGGVLPARPAMRPAPPPVSVRRMEPIRRHAMDRRFRHASGIVPIYRPWYGNHGGGSVSQTIVFEERARSNPYGVTSFYDVPTVAGIRSAPAGAPTTYVLHPVPRRVADRSSGPRIIELDGARTDEANPTGPRIVHVQVRRDPPRRR